MFTYLEHCRCMSSSYTAELMHALLVSLDTSQMKRYLNLDVEYRAERQPISSLQALCCLCKKVSHTGAATQAVAFPINTRRWGNALAIWLGITPADLFLYVFLPPMLVDAAVRISFFHFRKVLPTALPIS